LIEAIELCNDELLFLTEAIGLFSDEPHLLLMSSDCKCFWANPLPMMSFDLQFLTIIVLERKLISYDVF